MDPLALTSYFGSREDFPLSHLLRDLGEIAAYFREKKAELERTVHTDILTPVDPATVIIKGEVHIGEGCEIDPFVLIEGPVWIGNRVQIRSGALIRSGCVIGDDAVLGHGIEIKNIHVARGAKIQTNSFVGDAIIGTETRVASGAILANRRFDQAEVILDIEGQKISTGRDKFGCVIGDRTRIGANVTTSPGTIMGKECLVYSNASLAGYYPARSIVKLRQNLEVVPRLGDDFSLRPNDFDGHR